MLVPAGSCGMRLLRPPGAGGRAEECPCCGGFPLPQVPCTRCSAGWGQRGIVWGQAGAFGSLLGLRVGFSGAFQLPESRTQKSAGDSSHGQTSALQEGWKGCSPRGRAVSRLVVLLGLSSAASRQWLGLLLLVFSWQGSEAQHHVVPGLCRLLLATFADPNVT